MLCSALLCSAVLVRLRDHGRLLARQNDGSAPRGDSLPPGLADASASTSTYREQRTTTTTNSPVPQRPLAARPATPAPTPTPSPKSQPQSPRHRAAAHLHRPLLARPQHVLRPDAGQWACLCHSRTRRGAPPESLSPTGAYRSTQHILCTVYLHPSRPVTAPSPSAVVCTALRHAATMS